MSSEKVAAQAIYRSGSARLPTAFGEFTITVYRDREQKEHLAIRMGDLEGTPPLVRIHSECLTGDVFGSVRCDCGEQLQAALRYISEEGRGLLLYLRQEGRGIGLNNKIRAYALQDQGMDTVEANIHLGFPADARNYTNAAAMLKDHNVHAVRLATNNPEKVKALEACGIRVMERVRYQIQTRPENYAYLKTKVSKLGHLFTPLPPVERAWYEGPDGGVIVPRLTERLQQAETRGRQTGLPTVTLSYAQSLDGSIAARPGKPLQLSNPQSQALTHHLRSLHDAVLVGINTVMTDDPRLTVRLVAGKNPQPIVLDSRLRLPLSARLLHPPCVPPIIVTSERASESREKRLRDAGATIMRLPSKAGGRVDLCLLLRRLFALGIRSVMVEGGSQVITGFLTDELVDQMIVTIAPQFVGGLNAIGLQPSKPPIHGKLTNVCHQSFAGDLVLYADVENRPARQKPSRSRLVLAQNSKRRTRRPAAKSLPPA